MDDKLPFCVLEIADNNSISETLAQACNLLIGKSAFKAAIELRPKSKLRFQHGARVIDQHNIE